MIGATSFLTLVGRGRRPDPGAVAWFGPVGVALGLALGGLWWGLRQVWPATVAGALVVAADLALTGMLHFDGLVDSADGLLPHMDRERRLEVMRAPDAGAFGVAVGSAALLLRWAALAALRPAPFLLGALWCASRGSMGLIMVLLPYARGSGDPGSGGLASGFLPPPPAAGRADILPALPPRPGRGASRSHQVQLAAGLVSVAGALALSSAWSLPAGPVAVGSSLVAGAGVAGLARRRLGGYTGDVLGAAGVVAETVGLLVASARW